MNINLFRRLESWAVPALILATLSVFLYDSYKKYGDIIYTIEGAEERRIAPLYDWWSNAFWPLVVLAVVVYACWLLIDKILSQNLWIENRRKCWIYGLSILALVGAGALWYLSLWKDIDFRYIVDYCMNKDYESWVERTVIGAKVRSPFRLLNIVLLSASIMIGLAIYTIVSQLFKWSLAPSQETDDLSTKIIREGSGLTIILWVIYMINFSFVFGRSFHGFPMCAVLAFGHAYLFHHRLVRIPSKNERPAFWQAWKKALIYLLLLSVGVTLIVDIGLKLTYPYHSLLSFSNVIETTFEVLVFAVVTVFLRQLATRPLSIRLGRKQAELSGLRAQVNPHFLFNALNTLYSTALTENASRTSQGIQKLSDMMRFMLHENNKDAIDIRQEVNYLRNYIDLQQLRIADSDMFELKVNLDDTLCLQNIAPMLLVPFVENAFKHGVSMRQKSWIDIRLHCDGNRLYFSVFNSVHHRLNDDPERMASGIGLENVKKRLELLYPKNHNLTIHETEREFSVNLEIKC